MLSSHNMLVQYLKTNWRVKVPGRVHFLFLVVGGSEGGVDRSLPSIQRRVQCFFHFDKTISQQPGIRPCTSRKASRNQCYVQSPRDKFQTNSCPSWEKPSPLTALLTRTKQDFSTQRGTWSQETWTLVPALPAARLLTNRVSLLRLSISSPVKQGQW